MWAAVKNFIEETTAMKISVTSSATDAKMLTHINPEQLEEKYGGEEPNVTNFWPPKPNKGDFFISTDVPSQILSGKK